MIELRNDELTFRFPEVHKRASCGIELQRTLRIPDDNQAYPLPPGLGRFPMLHVDDHAQHLPDTWARHGGVFVPMYQSEALWINFTGSYPCAVKIAAGKINAVTGEAWSNELSTDKQDYLVIPDQPWLDGFNVSEDFIRQFVAMPLGQGFTAEEQITGEAQHGGLQIIVYPMKRKVYKEHRKLNALMDSMVMYSLSCESSDRQEMGLAPGGLMRQTIHEDEYGHDVWDQDNGYRCFVHLANSEQYLKVTGTAPPHQPPTAQSYTLAGLPWFEHYSDTPALAGSEQLGQLHSVAAATAQQGKGVLAGNESVNPKNVTIVRDGNTVRAGEF